MSAFARLFIVPTLLLFAAAASAQTIYKQIDADGRVTFSDRPDPAAQSGQLREVERSLATMTPISSWRNSQINANESARRARGELRKQAGAKPIPRPATL